MTVREKSFEYYWKLVTKKMAVAPTRLDTFREMRARRQLRRLRVCALTLLAVGVAFRRPAVGVVSAARLGVASRRGLSTDPDLLDADHAVEPDEYYLRQQQQISAS